MHFPALIEGYDPLMKHLNQTRAVLLSLCLLLLPCWSAAQNPLLTDTDRTAGTNAEVITIPSGTHLLMKLISPLHTTSATPGSGVYLETAFPVLDNGHVVIPEHTRVMGTVEDERRPGRVQGRAQMRLTFTQLILPDNRELSIVGNLQSLPGSRTNRTVNHEGTIEPVDQIDADIYTVAKTTGLGVLVGSVHHVGIGVGNGALIGAGLGLAKVLFTRGNEISLPAGSRVEMVLQHPLTVQASSRSTLADSAEAANLLPSGTQGQNTNRLRDNIPCLRNGVTLQCVDP